MRVVRISRQSSYGFTLIEILLTTGIIAILAGIVIVAIRPKENLADSKDARRRQDLKAMIDAIYQYQINYSVFPSIEGRRAIDTEERNVCVLTSTVTLETLPCDFVAPQAVPLGPLIPKYLANLPRDPNHSGNEENCGDFAFFSTFAEDCITGYQLWLDDDSRIHAFAPLGNDGQGIELAR